MYERNAIVLERYFNQMFGYNMKNNIKTNFKDYCELVECLEKYKNISEEEENIMQEYDAIANKIREIQKAQEILNKKNAKYQEERANLFQNIDENSENIQKKLNNINNNIQNLNEEIKENAQQFVDIIAQFNEKTLTRTNCGRNRRTIESEYNKKLNETLDNYKEIDINLAKKAKQFIEAETEDMEKELKEKIKKNGEKEKIPFNTNVITKAITLSIYIQKRETDILANVYEKTNKLFTEIKNNTVKSDKHEKTIKDSKSKLEFIGAIKEYLIQFLDNERLTAVNGEEEHNNLMQEACNNLEEDLEQINNLYTLLLKEITNKITKKSYSDLYNVDYLKALETKSKKFDDEIKKLNLPVTIINPSHWRMEGMKKIYDVFYQCVTEEYGRDLSEYIPIEETIEEEEEIEEIPEEKEEEPNIPKTEKKGKAAKKESKTDRKNEDQDYDAKTEIDKKIDMILGFQEGEEEDWEEDEEDWEEDDLEEEDDDWGDEQDLEEEEEDDWEEESDDEDWEEDEDQEDWEEEDEEDDDETYDEEDWRNEKYFADSEDDDFDEEDFEEEEDDDWEDDFELDDEEDDDEEENDEISKPKTNRNTKNQKSPRQDDSWENQFIRIDKKEESKKKKGFFDKFKK